jgi:hypothetical protein
LSDFDYFRRFPGAAVGALAAFGFRSRGGARNGRISRPAETRTVTENIPTIRDAPNHSHRSVFAVAPAWQSRGRS